MNYDSTIHEQARQELENLQKYEEPRRRLEEADKLIGQEREDISRFEKTALELQDGLKTDCQQQLGLASEVTVLPQVSSELARTENRSQTAAGRAKTTAGEHRRH